MDNFYTKHKLARTISKFSDNDVKVIGTVRGNFIDGVNRENVLKAVANLKDQPRHSLYLVRALKEQKTPPLKKRRVQSNTMDRYLNQNNSSPTRSTCASKAGYIIWKDKKIIPFYTNDLAFTPNLDILEGTLPEAVRAVHGLAPLKRWTGSESVQRTTVMVPAPIVAYNMFMGSVDIMDQKRECTSVKRKEKHLSTDIFNYVISLVCLNAHAIYDQLRLQQSITGKEYTHTEFKRLLAEQFCSGTGEVESPPQTPPEPPAPALIPDMEVPLHKHQMSQIEGNTFRPSCYVCTMYECQHKTRKSKPRVNMVCLVCKAAFHPTCFTAYHNPDTVTNQDVRCFLRDINPPKKDRQLKLSVTDIKVAPLPFQKMIR